MTIKRKRENLIIYLFNRFSLINSKVKDGLIFLTPLSLSCSVKSKILTNIVSDNHHKKNEIAFS